MYVRSSAQMGLGECRQEVVNAFRPPTLSGVALGAVVVLIVTAATATAAALITGADIKNNTVASATSRTTTSSAPTSRTEPYQRRHQEQHRRQRRHQGRNRFQRDILKEPSRSRPQPGCSDVWAVWPFTSWMTDTGWRRRPTLRGRCQHGSLFTVSRPRTGRASWSLATTERNLHDGDAGAPVEDACLCATEEGCEGIWTQKVTGTSTTANAMQPPTLRTSSEFFRHRGGRRDARQLRVRLLPGMAVPTRIIGDSPTARYLGREYRRCL